MTAAVVCGLDSHGLAVARALDQAGVPVYALHNSGPLPGAYTKSVRRVFPADDLTSARIVPALLAARRRLPHKSVALRAVNDRQVGAIATHIGALRPHYRVAWGHSRRTVLDLLRKDKLEAWTRRQGLRYPRSVVFDASTGARAAAGFQFPVIIKPVRPLSSFKTLLAHDLPTLERLLARQAHDLPIAGQEYIEGDDRQIYFGALMLDRGRVVHGMVGRKIASHPPARGQTLVAETVDEPEVLRLTEQFFAGTRLSGPVSLELKRDPQGRYWVIEPTVGRTDFWAQLCISAGFNQPLMEYLLACDLPVSPPDEAPLDCVWYDSERDPLAFVSSCWQEQRLRPHGKTPVFPYYGHGDWRPWAYALWRFVQSRGERWWRRVRPRPAPAADSQGETS
jgi:predicted ATP-grasp superfamily ATP-dependent carboligase